MHDKWIANTSSNKSVIADSGSRIYGGNNAVQYNSHFREKKLSDQMYLCIYVGRSIQSISYMSVYLHLCGSC